MPWLLKQSTLIWRNGVRDQKPQIMFMQPSAEWLNSFERFTVIPFPAGDFQENQDGIKCRLGYTSITIVPLAALYPRPAALIWHFGWRVCNLPLCSPITRRLPQQQLSHNLVGPRMPLSQESTPLYHPGIIRKIAHQEAIERFYNQLLKCFDNICCYFTKIEFISSHQTIMKWNCFIIITEMRR